MGERLSKFFSITRKYGIAKSLALVIRYFKATCIDKFGLSFILNRNTITTELRCALGGRYDKVIIRRSSFGYDVPLFQRPQHLARSMAEKGCLVFYEVSSMTDRIRGIKKVCDNLYLINLTDIFICRKLMKELREISKPKYIEIYSTDRKPRVKDIFSYKKLGYKIIYQYIDHISPALSCTRKVPKSIVEKYRLVISDPEIYVVATSSILYEDIRKQRRDGRLVLSTNGVDNSHFENYSDHVLDDDFINIAKFGRPVICYYGAIASWIDYDLLSEIDLCGRFSVVLIGAKYDDSFCRLSGMKNVFYLGKRDYKALKYYGRASDTLIIPFLINDITRATSPVKLFEYMAIGRPIVCTDMDECRKYKSVLIGKNHADFISQLDAALQLKNDEVYTKLLKKEALENDWHIKAKEIIDLLGGE